MLLVGTSPASVHHGLARGLDEMFLALVAQGRTAFLIKRPDSEQRLVQEILFVAVGDSLSANLLFVPGIHSCPLIEMIFPLAREFRKNVETGPNIFASLRVVGRAGVETAWPLQLPILEEGLEVLT